MFNIIYSLIALILLLLYLKDSMKYSKVVRLIQDYIDVGAIDDATKSLKSIPFYKRDNPMSRWLQAQIYFHNGQYVIAMTKLQDILAKKKYEFNLAKVDVMKLLIEVYNKTNMYKEAYELLEATLKLDPKNPYLNKEIGKLFFAKGDYSSAKYYLSIAVTSGSSDYYVFYLLAKMEYDKNAFVNALSYIERALELNRSNTDVLMLYAILKFNSKNYTVASKIFSKLLVDDNYGNTSLIYKTICLFNLKDFEEACSIAESILLLSEIDTSMPIYMVFLKTYAEALIENKKILETEKILNIILGMDSDDIFALNYITIFRSVFRNPGMLLDFITLDRVILKDKLTIFLNNLGYDISDAYTTDEEEYYFYAYPKEFNHNNILFIFSRGEYYIKYKSLIEYIHTAKNKKSAILYVVTPYYFVDECFDIQDNKLLIKLHDGSTLCKVLNNEIPF